MIEVKNLLFQPLTLHLGGGKSGLHLNPRARRRIEKDLVSPEIELAARRGFITLTDLAEEGVPSTPAETPTEPASTTTSPAKPRRRSGKSSASSLAEVGR